jgi:hypothetical protein
MWALLATLGCPDPTATDGLDRSTPSSSPSGSTADTAPTTSSTGPCARDPDLAVEAVSALPGLIDTLVQVDVRLSRPSSVAVQCTSDEDPAEVFFAEDLAETEQHLLRLSGLLPRTVYRCAAGPTCPQAADGPATFTYQTGEAPADLRELTPEVGAIGMDGAWTLAPYGLSAFFATTWIVIWGPDGRPRWWWRAPDGVGVWIEARYDLDRQDLVWGGGFAPDGRVSSVDLWAGQTYAWDAPSWESTIFHHDGKRVADGRLLTLEIRPNHQGALTWDGFGIRLHDQATGAVSWDFDSQELVDAGVLPGGGGYEDDPYHANWADWQDTPDGPAVYVSLCFSKQILAIDEATHAVRWQLGRGLGWTVQDAAGNPLGEEALPQCQHGLAVAGDRLLVYDNGQDRYQSAAEEWSIDGASRTATLEWSWTEAGWTEPYLGDVDWLPDGRVLVTEATSFGPASIVDLDPATGEVGGRLRFDQGGYTYRAERYQGCDLFTSVRACPALADRYAEVSGALTP